MRQLYRGTGWLPRTGWSKFVRALTFNGDAKDGAKLRLRDRRRCCDYYARSQPRMGDKLRCVRRESILACTDPPDSVGYKSLVRAASDLAAMGALPRSFFLALALPDRCTRKWFDRFPKGMKSASRELQIQIAGGDTTQDSKIAISITVLGEIAAGKVVKRSGARTGDLIFVSGRLGKAALGLALIRGGFGSNKSIQKLLEPHFYPSIQLVLGAWLARHGVASSMMDISDGLSTDLSRLCAASRVGARVNAELIPAIELSPAQSRLLQKLRIDPQQLALHGGDDYGLLFTVPRKLVGRMSGAPNNSKITQIGEIVSGSKITLVDPDGQHPAAQTGRMGLLPRTIVEEIALVHRSGNGLVCGSSRGRFLRRLRRSGPHWQRCHDFFGHLWRRSFGLRRSIG